MVQPILEWDVYEVQTHSTSINGVMFRGRVRKFSLEHDITCLVENTQDATNGVRFAVLAGEDISQIREYVETIVSDAKIELVLSKVKNPVLSKLKVNKEERYTL